MFTIYRYLLFYLNMQLRVPLLCGAAGLPVGHAIQVLEIMFETNDSRNNSSKMKLEDEV